MKFEQILSTVVAPSALVPSSRSFDSPTLDAAAASDGIRDRTPSAMEPYLETVSPCSDPMILLQYGLACHSTMVIVDEVHRVESNTLVTE
jgi:hypothetical protein